MKPFQIVLFVVIALTGSFAAAHALPAPILRSTQQQPPEKSSPLWRCSQNSQHPAFLGWCSRGTIWAVGELTAYQRMQRFYGLAQIAGYLRVDDQAITLLSAGYATRYNELFTLVQVSTVDLSRRVNALAQIGLFNWQHDRRERDCSHQRCYRDANNGRHCRVVKRRCRSSGKVGTFAGAVQVALLNRSDFYGIARLAPANINGSFYGLLQLGVANANDETYGASLALVNFSRQLGGLQIGLANATAKDSAGLQVGAIANITFDDYYGGQVGLYNRANDDIGGFQIGLINWATDELAGVQIGLVNRVRREMFGAQIGLANFTRRLYGLQIGLVNVARRSFGLQIGLINIVTSDEFPLIPLVNWSWS
jgi:hypothetical protein